MKPGDIVSFNIIKNGQVAIGVQGELVELNFTPTVSIVKTKHPILYNEPANRQDYFYTVSTASLKLIKSKSNNVFTQKGTIMRPKDYLESGRVVIFKDGSRGIVVSLKDVNFIMVKNKLIPLQEFDENLRYRFFKEYDIIKIAEIKEGYSIEYFSTIEEEKLDIIWKEAFYTIEKNKIAFFVVRTNPKSGEEFKAGAIGEIVTKDYKEKVMVVKTKTQLFKEHTSDNGYYYYTIPFLL